MGILLNMQSAMVLAVTSIKMKKQYYVVRITFSVNNIYWDAILGLNAEDALRRAKWNWEGEQVEIVG